MNIVSQIMQIVASFRKVEGLPEYLVIHKVIESRWRKCFGNLSKSTKVRSSHFLVDLLRLFGLIPDILASVDCYSSGKQE